MIVMEAVRVEDAVEHRAEAARIQAAVEAFQAAVLELVVQAAAELEVLAGPIEFAGRISPCKQRHRRFAGREPSP